MSSEAPQGVKISAYLFFGLAGLYVLSLCCTLAYVGVLSADLDTATLAMIAVGSSCFLILFAALYGGTGYGLLQQQSWSRIAAIVLSVLLLCSFPIGTIIGGVVIYFMFQEDVQQALA